MSTIQDAIDLTTSPSASLLTPLTSPSLRRRSASPAPPTDDSDRHRQKRRRVDVGCDTEHVSAPLGEDVDHVKLDAQQLLPPTPPETSQSSSVFTHIPTWEIPPDLAADDEPRPKDEEPLQNSAAVDRPVAVSSSDFVFIDLIDQEDSTVASSKVDQTSPDTAPTIVHGKSASPPSSSTIVASTVSMSEPLSAYPCPICLSPPTNATLMPCGHVCCGQCLFTAVKSTMRRNMTPTARCPVCRTEISGWDGCGGGVIGLKIQVLYSL